MNDLVNRFIDGLSKCREAHPKSAIRMILTPDTARDLLIALQEYKSDHESDKCILCEACGHKLNSEWLWCPWCRLETRKGRSIENG